LLCLRTCCKSLKRAIDDEIQSWCNAFSDTQKLQALPIQKPRDREEYYRVVVDLEIKLSDSFGTATGATKNFLNISRVNVASYLAALTGRCVLCSRKMSPCPLVQDSEQENMVPSYVFAHPSCQRKHMVVICSGEANPIQRGSEPRDLHRELAAVSSMNSRGIVVNRAAAIEALSPWYRAMYAPPNGHFFRPPIMVWLREHPLVRSEDTLYGALGLDQEDVKRCVDAMNAQTLELYNQSEQRRVNIAKKAQEIAEATQAEVRVWLGKGLTRWRSIEDMDAFHPDMVKTTGLSQFMSPSTACYTRRLATWHSAPVFNTLMLFDRVVGFLDESKRMVMVDWVVSSLGLVNMFGSAPFQLSHVEADSLDSVIDCEAKWHSCFLNDLSKMDPSDIDILDIKRVRGGCSDSKYMLTARLVIGRDRIMRSSGEIDTMPYTLNVCNKVVVSLVDMCKFKYVVSRLMTRELADQLPSIPSERHLSSEDQDTYEEERCFFLSVIRACFSEGAGFALAKALALLVAGTNYKEIVKYANDVNSDSKTLVVSVQHSEQEDIHAIMGDV